MTDFIVASPVSEILSVIGSRAVMTTEGALVFCPKSLGHICSCTVSSCLEDSESEFSRSDSFSSIELSLPELHKYHLQMIR